MRFHIWAEVCRVVPSMVVSICSKCNMYAFKIDKQSSIHYYVARNGQLLPLNKELPRTCQQEMIDDGEDKGY